MPGKSLATSLKRKRRALNDMHLKNALRLRFRLVSPEVRYDLKKPFAVAQACEPGSQICI